MSVLATLTLVYVLLGVSSLLGTILASAVVGPPSWCRCPALPTIHWPYNVELPSLVWPSQGE